VLGVALGGEVAASHGWRIAFMVIGLSGLALAIAYPIVVREKRIAKLARKSAGMDGKGDATQKVERPPLRSLFGNRSVKLAYLGSGLQLFTAGALPAWIPTYLGRYYGMPVNEAGRVSAILFLTCGTGMILCGMASDRIARERPDHKIFLAIAYCLGSALALTLALQCTPGIGQLLLLGVAMFLVAGTTGPAGAMVANLTPLAIHGTAFATLTLANNLLGLAPGPIVTGRLADSIGLAGAFQLLPLVSMIAAVIFAIARQSYLADLSRLHGRSDSANQA
jgi:MFS family permease